MKEQPSVQLGAVIVPALHGPPHSSPPPSRRGLALPEAACAVVILGAALALASLAGEHSRRNARLGHDLANLRAIYAGQFSFAADSQDTLPTFTWRAGVQQTPYPDLNFAISDMEAGVRQVCYIVRTRAGRTPAETPVIANLLAHVNYQQLILCEYLDLPVPSRLFVSAGDRNRLLWANDPRGYDQGLYTPNLGTGGPNWRHPYSTSFSANTVLFDRSPAGYRIYPAASNQFYIPGGVVFGGAGVAAITFPSQKVLLHDRVARFSGPRVAYCAFPEARLPFLMADGGVAVRSSAESNLGCDPNYGSALQVPYFPNAIEPPASGPNSELFSGRFVWPRGRIGGRDFGGPEAPN